jgi:hypothetical protein
MFIVRRGKNKEQQPLPAQAKEAAHSRRPRPGERSFTLIETMVALGLIVSVVLEVSGVLGRAIVFNEYDRKVTQASWLAKAVMAKIEWGKDFYEIKEFKMESRDQDFDEVLCPKDPQFNCDYKYNVTIKNWPLPLVDMLGEALLGPDGKKSPIAAMLDVFKSQLKEMIGEEFLKVAEVEVFWPEGSLRSSTKVTYLLTNQMPINEFVEQQPPLKEEKPAGGPSDPGNPPPPQVDKDGNPVVVPSPPATPNQPQPPATPDEPQDPEDS